ncbi:MAG: phenylalanine--tRNA ligase subunit alpha [Clostridia bacterium]|jgi:phenylalanyl-tRNA synthetase alpha chain|nr:phenylalanine--tRNA ligase subunit alpha [Clostridia bacterium]
MEENETLLSEAKKDADAAETSRALYEVKMKYLGRTGKISALLQKMKDAAKEDRPALGKKINDLRMKLEAHFEALEEKIKQRELEYKLKHERIDVTMPGKRKREGVLHPVTRVKNELIDVFAGMGFEIYEGPEIENEYYNFTALNTPADHPARDMQDTFYVTDEFLLRTQTSAAQIRVMEKKKPPIKILSPGRVFRSDDDATHSPMFHQMEGLVVDKGITLCDLQGMLDEFARSVFSDSSKTRLRPSYFPFTEPSVEVDVSCASCGGKGCSLCKGTGWIEVLGAGMVNRRVLENCGVDPDEYTGFAFGMGIERIAMLKYGINNIKLLTENDVRFLEQFKD